MVLRPTRASGTANSVRFALPTKQLRVLAAGNASGSTKEPDGFYGFYGFYDRSGTQARCLADSTNSYSAVA